MASIAFIISGILDELPVTDPEPVSEDNRSTAVNTQTRRYCDPPNMTALTTYYDSGEETNYDYDFLQHQDTTIQTNISASDMQQIKHAIVSDSGTVLSFFPAYYLTAKFGPSKVFACSTVALSCLAILTVEMRTLTVLGYLILPVPGVVLLSFYEMVFRFISDSREILVSLAAVKYVGVAICELIVVYHVFAVQRYKFYVALFISVFWFFLWFKLKFWPRAAVNNAERQKRHLRTRTPWRDILFCRPIWMTMFAIFAAGCGNSCISLVVRLYLKNVYYLKIDKEEALSQFLLAPFSIACGFSAYHLIKSKIVSVTSARRMVVYVSGLLFVLGFVGCGSVTPMILYCLAVVLHGANYTGIFSSPLDLAPKHSGPVLALCFTFGSLGRLCMDYLAYYILRNQVLVSWRFIFSLNSLILLVTAIFFMLRGSGSAQPWNDPDRAIIKERNKTVPQVQVLVTAPSPKPKTKSIYVVEKKILKVLHVQEPDKFTRVRAYSTSLPNERNSADRPNVYRPSSKKRASIS